MTLPIERDYAPMEAKLVADLPLGANWQFEPKWDGFRCLAFRDGERIDLMSKAGKPLARYFPDVVEAVGAIGATRFVIDGEIVIRDGDTLSFDELLMRIHPAKSRVEKLAREHPASLILFDMLVDAAGRSLVTEPLSARREALEAFIDGAVGDHLPIHLSPATTELPAVQEWFRSVGGGLDGVVAKRLDLPYQSGERTGMQKMKQLRTADCVVGGFRYGAREKLVGSLLLGLYDGGGLLHHVGFTSGLKSAEKPALTAKLEKLVKAPGFTGQAPGGPSRWSTERTGEWQPLAPSLVVEVQYDYFNGGRFRHGTGLVRWRPDKDPAQCTIEQVEQEGRAAMKLLRDSPRTP